MTKSQRQIFVQAWRERPVSAVLAISAVASIILGVYALAGGPGAHVVRWFALVPLFLGLLYHGFISQARHVLTPIAQTSDELQRTNIGLQQQVNELTRLRDVILAMGASFDREAVLDEITRSITEQLNFDRGLVLLQDSETDSLDFAAFSHAAPDPDSQFLLEQLQFELDDARDDPLLSRWVQGRAMLVNDAEQFLHSRLNWLITTLDLKRFHSQPLQVGDQFKGVIIADNSVTDRPISHEQQSMLEALAAYIAITLENARLYQHTDERLNARVQELEILSRMNRELNYTLSVERVLNLTLDWALRFTNADAAAVSMIDHDAQTMQFVVSYGYDPDQWQAIRQHPWPLERGISGRVARTNQPVNVPDVNEDPEFVEIVEGTRSQLSVPITREDRVVAVLSLESVQPSAFTEENMQFVMRLASRAGAAIDNANLYAETVRERHKLELILSNITNAVIGVDDNENLVLVNQAALHTFHLMPKEDYTGKAFEEIFAQSPLLKLFVRARTINRALAEELRISKDRTLHISIVPAPQIGWTIVAHDITPFKETEQLKNELVATASHDLKNPLGSIMGYMDLITMTNTLNPQGKEYARRVHAAVNHMRNLIDDLLDLARIESGITLRYSLIHLKEIATIVLDRFDMQARSKDMTLSAEIAEDLPLVPADASRITQIMANLVSNAIKYTPPEGQVMLRIEVVDGMIQITIRDNGMGISPEDQAQIFTRFYRVRTPETDAIEGTGLGLAIVKSLVELHGGQVGVESRLGEGSTFYVTLPLTAPEEVLWVDG